MNYFVILIENTFKNLLNIFIIHLPNHLACLNYTKLQKVCERCWENYMEIIRSNVQNLFNILWIKRMLANRLQYCFYKSTQTIISNSFFTSVCMLYCIIIIISWLNISESNLEYSKEVKKSLFVYFIDP
jgi:hypothetical protein